MNKSFLPFLIVCLCTNIVNAQIPIESQYLGQTPPGKTPKVFLSNRAERIAITNNGEEIYCDGSFKITKFKYSESGWEVPVTILNGFGMPALTNSGDTMFIENGTPVSYYSVRNGGEWTAPAKFWISSKTTHMLQKSALGNYFVSSNPSVSSIGDISAFEISETDTVLESFGLPINTQNNGVDFFMARDESYLILIVRNIGFGQGDVNISYKKEDGGWTNPKNLGQPINSSGWEWGPYVSPDEKYLFYTRDNNILWVKIDKLIDSLKTTNFVPYTKATIATQTVNVGDLYNYVFPDTLFFDDDGMNTITYSSTLKNGTALPEWLSFNSQTRELSGTPVHAETVSIKLIATDTANASASVSFTLKINPLSALNVSGFDNFSIYPNPSSGVIFLNIGEELSKDDFYKIEIYNSSGMLVKTDNNINSDHYSIDLSGQPAGIYLLKLVSPHSIATSKIFKL